MFLVCIFCFPVISGILVDFSLEGYPILGFCADYAVVMLKISALVFIDINGVGSGANWVGDRRDGSGDND